MPVSFTFDVEPHDRIEAAAELDCPPDTRAEYARRMEASTRWLLDTLAEHEARATFFIVGEIATSHPRLIRDIADAGHEVACHSWDHRRIHRLNPFTFRDDVRKAKHALEQAAGQTVVGYRAPTFSVVRETAWAIDVLTEEGFRYDSSVFPVRHDRYGVPDAPRFPFFVHGLKRTLLELPLATLGVGRFNLPAAGGGYFRLFPPAVMRAAVRQSERQPTGVTVLYFHPWEFDPDQPTLPLGRAAKFRTYVGISRTRDRLRRLLERYGSRTMIDAVAELEAQPPLPTFHLAAA
jgi:polysaccharide deacetylase family protein (PEP-CTERM system associated)